MTTLSTFSAPQPVGLQPPLAIDNSDYHTFYSTLFISYSYIIVVSVVHMRVSKAHLRGCSEKEVDSVEMVYSGVTEGRVKGSVAVLISENLSVCAKEWRCMNEKGW